ncbi:MAG: hypothetical protein J5856_02900, partial [Lachnospiraceae bacterium]|nr:hypothetical protein [Lachnospiraceae bacterium]
MESFIRAMTDFLVNLGVDPDKALMVSGLGLVVIGFIAVALLSQLLLLPGQVKNKKRMKHLTGRAVGTILNGTLYTETEYFGHQNGQTGETTTTHRYIVTYEFEVNGVTYRGQGEGSYAFWEKKRQK